MKDSHHILVAVLEKARQRTEEMLRWRTTHPLLPYQSRKLSRTEMLALFENFGRICAACLIVSEKPDVGDVPIKVVCGDEIVLNRLRSAGIRTVLDMWNFTAPVLVGILDDCGKLGAKGQYHMYLFARA